MNGSTEKIIADQKANSYSRTDTVCNIANGKHPRVAGERKSCWNSAVAYRFRKVKAELEEMFDPVAVSKITKVNVVHNSKIKYHFIFMITKLWLQKFGKIMAELQDKMRPELQAGLNV